MTSTFFRSSLVLTLPFVLAACSGSDDGDDNGGGGSGNDAGSSGTSNSNGGNGGSNSGGNAGNAQGGNAGDAAGGNGGSNTGGSGGSNSGGAGPGIPTDGEVFCANEAANADAAFYYGVASSCYVFKAATGSLTDQQKTSLGDICSTVYGGTVVTACPNDETAVAYCAGEQPLAGVSTSVTRIIYQSDVNPDAATVSKNAPSACGVLWYAGNQAIPLYDLNDQRLTSTCTGTLSAEVDGTVVDFSDHLARLFRTDGTKSTYLVRGYESLNTVGGKELTLKVIKDGAANVTYFVEVLQPAVGYLEGVATFGFPVDENALTIDASSYAIDGSGFAASFEIGAISSSPTSEDNVRTITGGEIDIQISE